MSLFTVRSDDPRNQTYTEALQAREADIKRLQHIHLVEWEWAMVEVGKTQLRWRCTCRPEAWYSLGTIETHIRDAIRAERGPKK